MNRSKSTPLIHLVKDSLDDVFRQLSKLHFVLGASGGPDSMALLYVFHRLDIDVTVIHCNYQLRGESSDNDQELVEQTASMWGYEAVSVRFDPKESTKNFQNFARKRRYQVFRDMKRELKADAIVTAHHQDDQLETIIQKLMRGSGMSAWQGMKAWDGELFRPLLSVSKADILEFASLNHVPYRLDSSNEESTYARNFLRNGWFPLLDDLFPGWRENILKIPGRAKEHEMLVDSLARTVMKKNGSLDRKNFLSLNPDIRKSVLLHILKMRYGAISVSSGALDNLTELDSLQTGKKLQITESLYLICDRDQFVVEGNEPAGLPASSVDREKLLQGKFEKKGLEITLAKWDGLIDERLINIDADKLEWPLVIRTWQEGDRINPLGMKGHQTIADLLTNRKISSAEKPSVQVIETSAGKICAVLFPRQEEQSIIPGTIADWAKCTPNTKTVVQIVQN